MKSQPAKLRADLLFFMFFMSSPGTLSRIILTMANPPVGKVICIDVRPAAIPVLYHVIQCDKIRIMHIGQFIIWERRKSSIFFSSRDTFT
jgi:hypothetical protein